MRSPYGSNWRTQSPYVLWITRVHFMVTQSVFCKLFLFFVLFLSLFVLNDVSSLNYFFVLFYLLNGYNLKLFLNPKYII